MHVPDAGSGVVPGGQHVPQEVTCAGLQQAPSNVIPSLGFEQGVTQLPLPSSLTWPAAQFGGGHMPPKASVAKFAGRLELSQRQTDTPPVVAPEGSAWVPLGHSQAKMNQPEVGCPLLPTGIPLLSLNA